MTRYSPNDAEFNAVANREIEGTTNNERVVFIDQDNKILEAIYASQFQNGLLQKERERLKQAGVLKGIVHVGAATLGSRGGIGRQYSTVVYCPDDQYYVRARTVFPSAWISDKQTVETTVQATQDLFNNSGEEDDEQEA